MFTLNQAICLHMGGVMRGVGGGGVRVRIASRHSPITLAPLEGGGLYRLAGRSTGPCRQPMGLGSKCSEILIRQSNGLNACRGVDPHQRFIKTSVFVSFSVCGRLHLQQRSQPQSAVTSLERGV